MKVGIVGAGVFGCVIAKALSKHCDVTVFDCRKKEAASKCSGFLMKDSWFAGLGKKITEPALDMLGSLYKIQSIKFKVGPLRTLVYRIAKDKVLEGVEVVEEKVKGIGNGRYIVTDEERKFDAIIVAAGIWSNGFFPKLQVTGKKGISFEWEGKVKRPFIRPWAPYKQVVVFNVPEEENKVWGGDGSAIKQENWTDERERECLKRVAKAAGLDASEAKQNVGIRPFVEGRTHVLEKVGKRYWVATGGGKNGTILAGYVASQIEEKLSGE